MATRRQEKVARVIKESVSKTILTRLSDPRIQGLVTVTEVDVSPDMKQATVFLSVLGVDEAAQQLTVTAICHAAGVIQAALGHAMTSRFVPHLKFEQDRKFQKTLETFRLIEQAREEWQPDSSEMSSDSPERPDEDGPDDEEQ